MKRRFLIALAVLCTVALPLGCGVENTPDVTTTTADSTTTKAVTTTTAEEETTERTTTTTKEETTVTEEVTSTTASKPVTVTKPQKTTTTGEETTTTKEETTTTQEETTTTEEITTTVAQTTSSSRRTVSVPSRTTASSTTTAPRGDFFDDFSYPITPTKDIDRMSLSITNQNAIDLGKIESEVVRVTEFDPKWAFMHHTQGIVYFKGKFYTAFSRGYWGEDFPGQQMVISVSDDFYTWSDPTVIFPATEGMYGETSIIPAGFYTFGEYLIANVYITDYQDPSYFKADGSFNPNGSGKTQTKIRQIYSADGVNWSEPKNISSVNTLAYPRQLSTGRWFSCNGKWMHFTDEEIPDGLSKWNWYVMPEDMQKSSQERNGGKPLTEGSWYESPDGIIHSMIRSDSGYVFHAASYDGGVTLTEHYPTRFSSDNTQFNFWNLEDGRILGIGTPNENSDIWDMSPLNIYVSMDGYNFKYKYTLRDETYTLKQEGYSKGGQYAYMKMLEHDGYLYIFYSRMKEVMEVSRVKVSDIDITR